jgi:hypothetical protein
LFVSSNIIRATKLGRRKWAGHVVGMGKNKSEVNFWSEKLDVNRPLGRTRCGWENNNKTD